MATKRRLLVTFDALGTLYRPRQPIAVQYAEVARKLGFPEIEEADLHSSFIKAFKKHQQAHPNYGKAQGMDATTWWKRVIQDSFKPFETPKNPIPSQLSTKLISRFSTAGGYSLYHDAADLLATIRRANHHTETQESVDWPWDETIVGIISNSDDRVPAVLRDLGIRVAPSPDNLTHGSTKDVERYRDYVHFCTLSYDAGCEKPDPKIFHKAYETASQLCGGSDLDEYELLHVGDSMSKDVEGALAANWDGILIHREDEFSQQTRSDHGGEIEPESLSEKQASGDVRESRASQRHHIVHDLRDIRFWRPQKSLKI